MTSPWKIIISLVFNFFKGNYFLGRQGRKYCRGGKTITDVATCQKACENLNIPIGVAAGDLVAGTDCFKNVLTGKCNQHSKSGEKDYMICEKGNVMRKSIFGFLNPCIIINIGQAYCRKCIWF